MLIAVMLLLGMLENVNIFLSGYEYILILNMLYMNTYMSFIYKLLTVVEMFKMKSTTRCEEKINEKVYFSNGKAFLKKCIKRYNYFNSCKLFKVKKIAHIMKRWKTILHKKTKLAGNFTDFLAAT